ncbi:MAG: WD40 repeat domain-containing protein [Euryarchaeota archaeon]|jgi:WD40 repeat protein|nr:WD40 repeat domain-containing protein [Euryarchaeota archaeon]
MRRVIVILCILLLLPLTSAVPDATVHITLERRLSNYDIGINGGVVSPNGVSVLIYGEDGYVHLLSTENADDESTDIVLENETTNNLNAASWHPGGKSALIVGDSGTVLRYNSTNYALGEAEGSFSISNKDINAIQFTPGSSVAYLGTDDGQIWKYYADTFTMLDNQASSRVTDIACMKNENICVASTLNDGLAVIDQADKITWLPQSTPGHTWVGVGCEDPTMNYCTGFASGKKVALINIDVLDSSKSTLGDIIILGQLEGDSIAENPAADSSTLIALAPLGIVRWTLYTEEAFLMFSNKNASDVDIFLSGDSYGMAWENSENTGFLVTSQGRIVSFAPATEDASSSMPTFVLVLIALCVPGVFIGLLYWNVPWLQRKYAKLVGRGKKSDNSSVKKEKKKNKKIKPLSEDKTKSQTSNRTTIIQNITIKDSVIAGDFQADINTEEKL